jgi:hypothetical protein
MTASVDSPLLGDNDVLRGATICEVAQAVFTASQLGALIGYIGRPFDAEELVGVRGVCQSVAVRELDKSQSVSDRKYCSVRTVD